MLVSGSWRLVIRLGGLVLVGGALLSGLPSGWAIGLAVVGFALFLLAGGGG